MWICSIDIGKKNFAFYIEEFNIQHLKEIILPSVKYKIDGKTV